MVWRSTLIFLWAAPADVRIGTMEGIALPVQGKRPEALAASTKALTIAPQSLTAVEGAPEIRDQAESHRAVPPLNQVLKQVKTPDPDILDLELLK